MHVLICGAAGYIGQYLAWKLEANHQLRLADVTTPDPARIPWVYEAHNVERKPEHTPKPDPAHPFMTGSILDPEYCRQITKGVDAVILLSGHVKHEELEKCFAVNAQGTFNMVVAAAENGVKRFLCASSINASGWFYCRVTNRPRNWPFLPVDETIPPDHEDAYSLSKYTNELTCAAWTNRTGMNTAAFRFSGVFPPEWTESYAKKAKPAEKWDEELASYIDLRDVVSGLQQALEYDSLPASGVYQLVAADTQYMEPTMEIIERFRPELLKVIREPLPGRTSLLTSRRANEGFGFVPQHTWMTG